jgi:uncharacterized protein (DUF885 family)
MSIETESFESNLGKAMRIIDDAWDESRRSVYIQMRLGIAPSHLPDLSFREAQRRSQVGRSLLDRLARLNVDGLPHDLALTLRFARFRAEGWAREADWYWHVVDGYGWGFPGMFLPTAYNGGFLINFLHRQFGEFQFDSNGDCDRYLALIADYARLIDEFSARTLGQRERGILMPKPQIPAARTLTAALTAGVRGAVEVQPERLRKIEAAGLAHELERRLTRLIIPAYDRLLSIFSDDYWAKAPDEVGMAQYPGGAQIYAELVKRHTTLDLTPDQVHAKGLERILKIEASMQDIRTQLGFAGDKQEFAARLEAAPHWRANTVAGVSALFERYLRRIAPHMSKYFSALPEATHGVAPLPTGLQDSMTFGYYDAPRPDRRQGLYYFNGRNLTRRSLFNVAALTYHELIPGHHLHFATQQENSALHPLRAHGFINAFNEGWAEYAATVAGEMGMYEEPEERYGASSMDAFLTTRLVVDTGMNVLGWSLNRARDYMREHAGVPEAEVLTETLRYSCDIPAQALAYKLGDTFIMSLRERMRVALGARFEVKEFHSAVLRPGALPLSDLNWHIDREIERLRAVS